MADIDLAYWNARVRQAHAAGCSIAEIAACLDLPLNFVEAMLSRETDNGQD